MLAIFRRLGLSLPAGLVAGAVLALFMPAIAAEGLVPGGSLDATASCYGPAYIADKVKGEGFLPFDGGLTAKGDLVVLWRSPAGGWWLTVRPAVMPTVLCSLFGGEAWGDLFMVGDAPAELEE